MAEEKKGGGPNKPKALLELLAERLNVSVGVISWALVALGAGFIIMTFWDYLGAGTARRPSGATEVTASASAPQDELVRMEREMARDLESALTQIQGAGAVHVKVTLESGPAVAAVADTRVDKSTTTEKAGDNSTRQTDTTNTTTTNVMIKSTGADALAVAKRSRATVAGVIVVAEGARVSAVKSLIFQATVRALGVAANRVDVYPAEGR